MAILTMLEMIDQTTRLKLSLLEADTAMKKAIDLAESYSNPRIALAMIAATLQQALDGPEQLPAVPNRYVSPRRI